MDERWAREIYNMVDRERRSLEFRKNVTDTADDAIRGLLIRSKGDQ
jgi:hypothetical protein